MNRERLEEIVDRENGDAQDGCPRAQSLVINALAELDNLDMFELMIRRNQQSEEEQA
tara:strand:+ start:1121 stop:1291 length:171 start_codon:yes stop_codon:yes gene_type:complete